MDSQMTDTPPLFPSKYYVRHCNDICNKIWLNYTNKDVHYYNSHILLLRKTIVQMHKIPLRNKEMTSE